MKPSPELGGGKATFAGLVVRLANCTTTFAGDPCQTRGYLGADACLIADLVVLDGDPMVSISEVRQSRRVVAGGVVYTTADLCNAAGFEPQR
jgi:hypothetical protein